MAKRESSWSEVLIALAISFVLVPINGLALGYTCEKLWSWFGARHFDFAIPLNVWFGVSVILSALLSANFSSLKSALDRLERKQETSENILHFVFKHTITTLIYYGMTLAVAYFTRAVLGWP